MARKKTALLHIGPGPTPTAHGELATYGELLDTVALILPIVEDQITSAEHEMLRTHKAARLKRKQVEGSWAAVVRAATREKADVVISAPRFHEADEEQAALLLHQLGGFDVHVLVTPYCDEEDDTEPSVTDIWLRHLDAERLHVSPLSDDASVEDLAEELVGLALHLQKKRLDARIAKLKKRRRIVRRRLDLRDAS